MEEDISFNNTSLNGNFNNYTALQIRLDNRDIIEDMELFLTGKARIFVTDEHGRVKSSTKQISTPLANASGIHYILNYVRSNLNPSNVQGNFDENMYYEYVFSFETDLKTNLMINLTNFEINDDSYMAICDYVTNMAIPFFTRLLFNKERESYESTVRTVESSTIREGNNERGLKL